MRLSGRLEALGGIALLALLVAGCLVVLQPFLSALIWALILSYSTWPLYRRLLRWVGGHVTLAAGLMTLLVALILVVPLAILGITLADHVAGVFGLVRLLLQEGLPAAPEWVHDIPLLGPDIDRYWQSLTHDGAALAAAVEPYLGRARDWALQGGAGIGGAAVELTLSVFACFFFYRDGREAAAQLSTMTKRLAGGRGEHLLEVGGSTISGVVYGVLGTAIVQGALAAIGFWIADVPGALLLGFVTFVFSFIPAGPPLVWIPATVWLFYTHAPGWGIFLGIWGIFVVSGVDNILRPYLISRESRLPFLLVLLGVIGGVLGFGFVGVFLGPVLLAVGFTLLKEWTSAAGTPGAGAPPGETSRL
ncbi:MAG: AI-2E family transporter [Dongiaceae bacterium]